MIHEPFAATIRDGRIYGRGSADMKAGVAAMCAAAALGVSSSARRQILITAVVDEEYESLGTRALIDEGITADMAIVTEPTRLALCPAHRGFAWFDVHFTGRAAHGSRYDIGVDAITHAGLLLAELHRLEQTREGGLRHPLLERGSLHASTIAGGVGMSTYPESCSLTIERRTLPGETADQALLEITEACARIRQTNPSFDAKVTLKTAQVPSDVPPDSEVVRTVLRAMESEHLAPRIEGLSAWTDAALFNAAGIPAVCFGPGDISLAHAAEEYVPVHEIEQATRVLARIVTEWCA
jgi:acetylornithine deacetylase